MSDKYYSNFKCKKCNKGVYVIWEFSGVNPKLKWLSGKCIECNDVVTLADLNKEMRKEVIPEVGRLIKETLEDKDGSLLKTTMEKIEKYRQL